MKRVLISIVVISLITVSVISLFLNSPSQVVSIVVFIGIIVGMVCFLCYVFHFSEKVSNENIGMKIDIWIDGKKHIETREIKKDQVVIGSSKGSDVSVSCNFISEEWFKITSETGKDGGKRYYIERIGKMPVINKRTSQEVLSKKRLRIDSDVLVVKRDNENYVEFSFEHQ